MNAFLPPYSALPAKEAFFLAIGHSHSPKNVTQIFHFSLYVAIIKHTNFPGLLHCLFQVPLLQILHL